MSVDRPGLFQRILTFILNISADPADSEYTRTIKRIYWAAAAFGIVASFSMTFLYFLSGDPTNGWLFLLSFVLFVALFVDGIRHPGHFRGITHVVLISFVVASVLIAVLRGGVWAGDGMILAGLMGPLLGLVYFSDRRMAVALFLVYSACVIGLAAIKPGIKVLTLGSLKLNTFTFWLGFSMVGAFIFGVIYFFVIQRERTHRLLTEEKAKSDRLLRRIEADLEQAARIQKDLLPKENPHLEGFDIAGVNVPCYEVGGDYYDFVPVDARRLAVVIADVAGKGIGASLLMATLRAALLAEVKPGHEIGSLAARLSDFVHKSSDPTRFVTFFYAEVEGPTGSLCYVNAGHIPPFVIDREGRIRTLESSGFPLGMFPGTSYQASSLRLEHGDIAVLFTDGIPDGRNDRGEYYTEDKLKAIVLARRALSASDLCRTIIDDVQSYSCGTEPCDDITLVIVKRKAIRI